MASGDTLEASTTTQVHLDKAAVSSSAANDEETPNSRRQFTPGRAGPEGRRDKWWKIHLFRGMINDLRRRAPYYWSDWRDAWDYRVVPATVYMYFAK